MPLPARIIVAVVIAVLAVAFSMAGTNGPMFYAVQSAAFEAHHGPALSSSSVGSVVHAGVDYGIWAVESVMEYPLYNAQTHVRRSIGFDFLLKPYRFGNFEPFAVAGAGYYWGSDPYQCVALDLGAGVRFYCSPNLWMQLDARDAIPYNHTLLVPSRFQIVGIGVGGRY